MEYIEYLFEKTCEWCEKGKFEGCDSYLSCPVYALYCKAKKKAKQRELVALKETAQEQNA